MGSKLNYVRGGLVVIPIVFLTIGRIRDYYLFFKLLTVLCLFFSTCQSIRHGYGNSYIGINKKQDNTDNRQ